MPNIEYNITGFNKIGDSNWVDMHIKKDTFKWEKNPTSGSVSLLFEAFPRSDVEGQEGMKGNLQYGKLLMMYIDKTSGNPVITANYWVLVEMLLTTKDNKPVKEEIEEFGANPQAVFKKLQSLADDNKLNLGLKITAQGNSKDDNYTTLVEKTSRKDGHTYYAFNYIVNGVRPPKNVHHNDYAELSTSTVVDAFKLF